MIGKLNAYNLPKLRKFIIEAYINMKQLKQKQSVIINVDRKLKLIRAK